MKTSAVLVSVILAAGLTGCKDEPSTGDLKDELNRMTSKCSFFEVKNVEKINGIKGVVEGRYTVEGTWRVIFTPEKGKFEQIYNDAVKAAEEQNVRANGPRKPEIKARLAEIDKELEDISSHNNGNIKVINNCMDQTMRQKHDTHLTAQEIAYCESLGSNGEKIPEEVSEKLRKEVKALTEELDHLQPVMVPSKDYAIKYVREYIASKCQLSPMEQVYLKTEDALRDVGIYEGTDVTVKGTFPMMKTDNGWIFSEIKNR